MKKLMLISGLLLSTSSFAATLHNYTDITTALTNGKVLHFVTDFAKCNAPTKLTAELTQVMIGAFSPNEIGMTNEHVITALTHFTTMDPYFPGKPVYEHARYVVTPDNNMNVSLQVFDAASYTLLKDNISFDCKIDQSTKVYS